MELDDGRYAPHMLWRPIDLWYTKPNTKQKAHINDVDTTSKRGFGWPIVVWVSQMIDTYWLTESEKRGDAAEWIDCAFNKLFVVAAKNKNQTLMLVFQSEST